MRERERLVQEEHLWPEESSFSDPGFGRGYVLAVARALLGESIPQMHATVACLPSFEPEWAIRVQRIDEARFTATLAEADSQIWPHGQQVNVTARECELPRELADGVFRVWRRMLEGTRYGPRRTLVLDGDSYHFACRFPLVLPMAGYTWAVDHDTPPGKLALLSEKLRQFILVNESQHVALAASVRECIDWFDAIPHPPAPRRAEAGKLLNRLRRQVQHYRDGITSETELKFGLTDTLDEVCYPPLSELIEIVEAIPAEIGQQIRREGDANDGPDD